MCRNQDKVYWITMSFIKYITLIAVGCFSQVLLDKCEKLHKCQLTAGTETFQQDPCPETSKYLEVHYQCRPNEFTSESVCEDEVMNLWCKRSTRIAIYSAMFGRTPNDTSLCESNTQGYINCKAEKVVQEVTSLCHGRKQCSIEAAENKFGNPCSPGIKKYLNVTYLCVPKNLLKKLRRRHKKKKKNKKDKITTTASSPDKIFTKPIPKPSITTTPYIYQKPAEPTAELVPAGNTTTYAAKPDNNRPNPTHHITYTKDSNNNNNKKDQQEVGGETVPTIICMNETANVAVGNQRDAPVGFLQDLFNAWYFLKGNQEKAILYFVIGVSFGIIVLLTVMLIKIGADYKRNMRAKLDVTEPTHSHNMGHNHNSLETPMLDGSDSLDRIEVVRFSPRGTLRNNDPGNRSLSNYYG
ncbi:latrophilin Cirl isoform X3 [Patella vulgata]|uniref:latrophilin Cirl isoform X3 n=1 Tax=Patella vulgata TaxID=6465 RepID=UPI00217FEE37|nr:latrophilin Cirl isoform X3 [Patella vulgata]